MNRESVRGVFFAFLMIVAFFTFLAPDFLTLSTWSSILAAAADLGVVAAGIAVLMIAGEFDLSVGANMALSGLIFASLPHAGTYGIMALLAALIAGSCTGLLNGVLVVLVKIPSFIVTLGTLMILRGIILTCTQGYPVLLNSPPGAAAWFSYSFQNGLPVSCIWWLALGLYLTFILNRTQCGNHILALGNQQDTAFLLGVPTMKVKLLCFTNCGFLAALAGIIQVARLDSLVPSAGDQVELYAIAAAVIGGVSLQGGQGSILGAMLGTLIICTVDTGLVQIGVSTWWYRALVGLVLILAVIIHLHIGKCLQVFRYGRQQRITQTASD